MCFWWIKGYSQIILLYWAGKLQISFQKPPNLLQKTNVLGTPSKIIYSIFFCIYASWPDIYRKVKHKFYSKVIVFQFHSVILLKGVDLNENQM